MDSDYQFVSDNVDGIRTIDETMERLIFGRKILTPLLGRRLVSPCHVYHIDLDEIDYIERTLEPIRPGQFIYHIQIHYYMKIINNLFNEFIFIYFITINYYIKMIQS